MTADLLRQAAALMRERAEAATSGRWYPLSEDYECIGDSPVSLNPEGDDFETASIDYLPNREHIASWGPVVALAAAAGMELAADALDARGVTAHVKPAERAWIDLARTYLGSDS